MVIKRLFIILLALLYLGVSSGATLHYQYCMGKLVKVSLGQGHTKKCHICGMERQAKDYSKCCTDKHQVLKSDKSIAVPYTQFGQSTYAILPSLPVLKLLQYDVTPLRISYPTDHAPPSGNGVPIFLRNCIFRI